MNIAYVSILLLINVMIIMYRLFHLLYIVSKAECTLEAFWIYIRRVISILILKHIQYIYIYIYIYVCVCVCVTV